MEERVPIPMHHDAQAVHYRVALERIAACVPQRFPSLSLQAMYLQNIALDALGDAGAVTPVRGRIRIRQAQLHWQKRPDHTIAAVEVPLRIGDLVGLMICAQYMKAVEGWSIAFQLVDPVHKAMKADILFQETIDEFLNEEGPNCGLEDPAIPDVYDPGPIWIASTFYHQRHGGRVLPRLCLDPAHYQGPELPWGEYAVFHPLYDPLYNKPRGMDDTFVDVFCDKLHEALGERALVVTDQPGRIHSGIRKIATGNLYDLAYLIGKAKVHLGGDTGFTHLAAAGRVKHLFALYGCNYYCDFGTASANICFDDLLNPFAAWGKYWGTGMDTRPKCDPAETTLHFHLLEDNRLPLDTMDAIVRQVQAVLGT